MFKALLVAPRRRSDEKFYSFEIADNFGVKADVGRIAKHDRKGLEPDAGALPMNRSCLCLPRHEAGGCQARTKIPTHRMAGFLQIMLDLELEPEISRR